MKSLKGIILPATAIILILLGFLLVEVRTVFAENEDLEETAEIIEVSETKYVTIFDNGEKLTVKTDAKTVGEVISRAEIILNDGDKIEPGRESEINMDNFFINIYRARPVVVKDGKMKKYLMTASYDAREIAREAGLTVYDGDEVKLTFNEQFLETGAVNCYEVTRNGGRNLTVEEEIAFTERTIKDYNLEPGQSEVRQLGEVGLKETTYNVLYVDGVEVSRELIGEEVVREPVERIVAVGASAIEQKPLTAAMGRNRYAVTLADGRIIERQETYYDLDMSRVIRTCGSSYSVRADGVKVDQDGYVLVAANLPRYPRCSVVQTSLGVGKVYDTGGFAAINPEQFDIATDWSNYDGR